jgi:hypothetical protein
MLSQGEDPGITYLHVDCDLYTGSSQALLLNAPRMRPGTVIIFDELINYPNYRDHEVKALWEWLSATGLHLRVIGVLPANDQEAMILNMKGGVEVIPHFIIQR